MHGPKNSRLIWPASPNWRLLVDGQTDEAIVYFSAADLMYALQVNFVYNMKSEKLLKDIKKVLNKLRLGEDTPVVKLDVEEVRSPESHAAIVGYMVAEGLEKRMPFRRILKTTVEKVMANRDVKGVKISVAGRLGGADMARTEQIKKGRIPLSTFRADVDFRTGRANLPYGVIGIKV